MAGKTTEAAMHVTLSGGKTLLAATHGVTKWREKPFAQNPRPDIHVCMQHVAFPPFVWLPWG